MWRYSSLTGKLTRADGEERGTGYSGHGSGKNNPAMQTVPRVGPIPEGKWHITTMITETATHGPFVLRLAPAEGTETFGRCGFLIHGDSIKHPGEASEGCISLPRKVREEIWASGDHLLEVVST